MESRRQQKVSKLLQKELGDIFLKDGKKMFNNSLITVTEVVISQDLLHAKVYLNILQEDDPKSFVDHINQKSKEIRNLLAQRIRHQIRRIPEVKFFYDDSLDQAEKMDKLFDKINKNQDSRENRNKLS